MFDTLNDRVNDKKGKYEEKYRIQYQITSEISRFLTPLVLYKTETFVDIPLNIRRKFY